MKALRGLRAKLVLAFAAVFGGVVLLAGTYQYRQVGQVLRHGDDQRLQTRARALLDQVDLSGPLPIVPLPGPGERMRVVIKTAGQPARELFHSPGFADPVTAATDGWRVVEVAQLRTTEAGAAQRVQLWLAHSGSPLAHDLGLVKTLLLHAQVLVMEAEHGAIAVELARRYHFDLILMNIQMPVMDGYAATALLRQQLGLATPIVALTANAIIGEREKCLAAGMNGYLAKPFREEELLKMVSNWVLPDLAVTLQSGAGTPPASAPSAAGIKPYQVDELLQVGQGDLEFVAFMLETFVAGCEDALRDLALGMEEGNLSLLKTTAHTLRPSLTHLRAMHILPPVEALDQWEQDFHREILLPLVESITLLLREAVAQIRNDGELGETI